MTWIIADYVIQVESARAEEPARIRLASTAATWKFIVAAIAHKIGSMAGPFNAGFDLIIRIGDFVLKFIHFGLPFSQLLTRLAYLDTYL